MISPNEFKSLRVSKGLTQKELADIVGTTQTTITNIEKGITKNPSVDIAIKISEALGKSVYQIFGEEGVAYSYIENSEEISRLKELVFNAIRQARASANFFKLEEIQRLYGNDWAEKGGDELSRLNSILMSFDFDLKKTLVNMGFCTLDELKEYNIKNWTANNDGKSFEESMADIRANVAEQIKNTRKKN